MDEEAFIAITLHASRLPLRHSLIFLVVRPEDGDARNRYSRFAT